MTERAASSDDHADAAAERAKLSYESHKLPLAVVLIWAGFLLFGLIYFLKQL